MNLKLTAILIATFATFITITDSAVSHDAIAAQSIPYNIFADFQYFWSKCVCVFNTVDSTMNDSKMDELWHNFRVQMTAIVNVEWNNCLKSTDTNQRRNCQMVVIGHAVQVTTKFVNELIYDHKLDLEWINKLRSNITTDCF